jgi:hypothetical protein
VPSETCLLIYQMEEFSWVLCVYKNNRCQPVSTVPATPRAQNSSTVAAITIIIPLLLKRKDGRNYILAIWSNITLYLFSSCKHK